jgi:hypothetical protein
VLLVFAAMVGGFIRTLQLYVLCHTVGLLWLGFLRRLRSLAAGAAGSIVNSKNVNALAGSRPARNLKDA